MGWGLLMASPARIKSTILRLSKRWQKRMGLSAWSITHDFVDGNFESDKPGSFTVIATTESQWQYMQAHIKWFMPVAERQGEEELEHVLVHEFCHILLSPEQTLIDTHTSHETAHTAYLSTEANALWERNYEHLELATEMTTKAVMAGWER